VRVDSALVVSVLLASVFLLRCGGDDSVNIDAIPQDKKLVDLSPPEESGVCQWAQGIARSKLPPAGTTLHCTSGTFTLNELSCMFPSSAQSNCTATVAAYRMCLPAFIDRLATDPCQIVSLALSGGIASFVEATPGCAGEGPCTFTSM
jgi:hypothetical protein